METKARPKNPSAKKALLLLGSHLGFELNKEHYNYRPDVNVSYIVIYRKT